jgi:arylsulfatase
MTIDIFPTLAGLIDAALPAHPIDGKSIRPLLTGESDESPQEAYFFYYNQNELHAMRSGKWKLVFPHGYRTMIGQETGKDGIPGKYDYSVSAELALYDLEADISESENLLDQYPEVVERLTGLADSMRADLGDELTGVEGSGHREPGRIDSNADANL